MSLGPTMCVGFVVVAWFCENVVAVRSPTTVVLQQPHTYTVTGTKTRAWRTAAVVLYCCCTAAVLLYTYCCIDVEGATLKRQLLGKIKHRPT